MDDWESATGSVAAMANVLGVRSAVASPIVVEGRLWGTMIAATNRKKPPPADTESRIVEFTALLATLHRQRSSRAEAPSRGWQLNKRHCAEWRRWWRRVPGRRRRCSTP